jgi:hypothetical protein
MCDPTVIAIGSTVAGIAGQAANMMGQSAAQNKQKQAYDEWAANQQKIRQEQQVQQEQERQKADAARVQGLDAVSADAQKQNQASEQARLTSYLQGQTQQATPQPSSATSVADKTLLSGQQSGDATFKADLAGKINQASADAKQRIAALAGVSSYGGSSGGLDITNKLAFQNAGMGIDEANDFRKGDLATYNIQRAVDPVQWSYSPSPVSGLASSVSQFGAQGLGAMLSKATASKMV